MKKIFSFLIGLCVVATSVFAADNVENQLKEMLKQELMSSDVEYRGDISLTAKGDGYSASIPAGILKSTKKVLPSFNVEVKKTGEVNNNALYRFSLNKLVQIYPTIGPVVEEYQIKYDTLEYAKNLIPAELFIPDELVKITNLRIPLDEGLSFSIEKFEDKTLNQKEDGKVQGKETVIAENIQATHLFGNLKIDRISSVVSAPISLDTNSLKDSKILEDLKKNATL